MDIKAATEENGHPEKDRYRERYSAEKNADSKTAFGESLKTRDEGGM